MLTPYPILSTATAVARRAAFLVLAILALVAASAAPALAAPGDDGALAANPRGNSVLQNNDLIRITVFQEDDLLTETRISKSGTIIFPLLGSLHLAGLSVDEATALIREKLDKDYIIHPQVTVTVLEYAKQWVTVLGEVQKPGTVEIPPEGNLDLLGAIGLAGGYTKIAAPNHITVRRQVNGQDAIIKVNGKDLAKDTNTKVFYVQPGDTIMVGQSLF